jgi:hypothetical protein
VGDLGRDDRRWPPVASARLTIEITIYGWSTRQWVAERQIAKSVFDQFSARECQVAHRTNGSASSLGGVQPVRLSFFPTSTATTTVDEVTRSKRSQVSVISISGQPHRPTAR